MLSVPTPSIVDQRRDQIVPKLDSCKSSACGGSAKSDPLLLGSGS